jgi:ribosomal protein S18 acetylase RimI-like enzyme
MPMNADEKYPGYHYEKWSGSPLPQVLITQVWAIAEDSFPPEEREPCWAFLESIEDGRSTLYIARQEEIVVGFTKLTRLGQFPIYLMEYLAVARQSRNQRIGSQIIAYLRKDLQGQPEAGMLLEVEPPQMAEGPERQLRERRIRFYQRHGAARILDHDAYRMPSTIDESSLWMHLMWLPVREGRPLPANLSLKGLLHLIFQEAYPGDKNHQLLNWIISQIPSSDQPIQLETTS